jgi:hypothetical protein
MGLTSDLKEWRDGILGDVQRMTSNVAAGIRLGRVVDVVFVLGAPGTPLTVGTHVFLRVGLNGPATILSWAMGATVAGAAASGAITVDLLTGASLSSLASICGGAPPAFVSTDEQTEVLPTAAWTVTLPDPSWLMASVTAADGVLEEVGLTLRVSVDPRG